MRKDMRSMAPTTTLSEEQVQSAGDGKYPLAPADFTDYYLKGVYSGRPFRLHQDRSGPLYMQGLSMNSNLIIGCHLSLLGALLMLGIQSA